MARTSLILLPSTQGQLQVVGEPVRTNGWFGQSDYLHTVSVHTTNFTGTVLVEASIALEPGEDDWFPAADPIVGEMKTGSVGFSFRGNYLWLRARVVRDGEEPPPPFSIDGIYGTVDRVFLNM